MFWATPSIAQGLPLALCSGVIPGGVLGSYLLMGIELRLTVCNANSLFAYWLSGPLYIYFLQIMDGFISFLIWVSLSWLADVVWASIPGLNNSGESGSPRCCLASEGRLSRFYKGLSYLEVCSFCPYSAEEFCQILL